MQKNRLLDLSQIHTNRDELASIVWLALCRMIESRINRLNVCGEGSADDLEGEIKTTAQIYYRLRGVMDAHWIKTFTDAMLSETRLCDFN